MSFTVLFRPPLVWIVAAELAVVAALGFCTWHVWESRQAAPQVAAVPPARGPALRQNRLPRPSPAPPTVAPGLLPGPGPTPGFGTGPDFLSRQMGELNRAESTFEKAEWRVTKAAVDAIQYYLEHVVLPSIEQAQRDHQ